MNCRQLALIFTVCIPFAVLANYETVINKDLPASAPALESQPIENEVSASSVVKIGNMNPDEPTEMKVLVTSDNWCEVRGQYDFFKKDVDWVGFVLKKGTLAGNIERYVATLYPESNGLINKVGRHLVPGDTCLTGPSADVIMQRIIEPYFAGDVPIAFSSFKNDFYALFYKDDPEFMRYRVGVRR